MSLQRAGSAAQKAPRGWGEWGQGLSQLPKIPLESGKWEHGLGRRGCPGGDAWSWWGRFGPGRSRDGLAGMLELVWLPGWGSAAVAQRHRDLDRDSPLPAWSSESSHRILGCLQHLWAEVLHVPTWMGVGFSQFLGVQGERLSAQAAAPGIIY